MEYHEVRIGFPNGNFLHVGFGLVEYLPGPEEPETVRITIHHAKNRRGAMPARPITIELPYHSIDYLIPDWGKKGKE